MAENRWLRRGAALAAFLGLWLAVRFVLPLAGPFLVAYPAALLLEGAVRRLMKRGLGRPAAAAIVTLAAVGLLLWGMTELTLRAVSAVNSYVHQLPELIASVGTGLDRLRQAMEEVTASVPEGSEEFIAAVSESVTQGLYSLPESASRRLLEALGKLAQASPDILLFAVTAGIGTYFFSARLPAANAFLIGLLPEKTRLRLTDMGGNLKKSFGGFMRSQLIMMAITFFILTAGFLWLRTDGAVGAAAVTALIDALPVFGTGAVLIPWGIVCLLSGRVSRGAWLLALWGLTAIVRNCLQAKLVGDQIGLDPISSLVSVYAGWRIWGVWGMLLCPILVVTVRQLREGGVISWQI